VRIGGESVGTPRAKIAPAREGLRPKSPTRRNVEQDRRRAEEGTPVLFGDLTSEAIVGGDPLRLTRVASPNCIGSLLHLVSRPACGMRPCRRVEGPRIRRSLVPLRGRIQAENAWNLLRPTRDALSRGLPIQQVLAAPRFALSTILARNARAFHYVRRSSKDRLS
jgi:hypothetical protein